MPASSSIVQWTCALEYLLDWMIFSISLIVSGWYPENRAIWLVLRAGGIFLSPDHGHGNQLR